MRQTTEKRQVLKRPKDWPQRDGKEPSALGYQEWHAVVTSHTIQDKKLPRESLI